MSGKKEITLANQVLNELRKSVMESLQQKGKAGEQKDGMDIALCALNTTPVSSSDDHNAHYTLQFAGANNPLYIITGNGTAGLGGAASQSYTPQLIEVKPDRMPVGIYPKIKDFSCNEITINKGDMLYLFSDGFADQFGGRKNKKFSYRRFKELLLSVHQKTMEEQKQIFDTTINDWKSNYEQIDDICVIGVRV